MASARSPSSLALPDLIPYNRPTLAGNELVYMQDAIRRGHLSSGGYYTRTCQEALEDITGATRVLLTHSATGALELACGLLDIEPGDEVVMPSFAFVSAANAVVMRGGKPVFVDVRPDTLNMDERLAMGATTRHTRAVLAVDYAGVGCEPAITSIEDAAQGIGASWRGRPLGTRARLGVLSFHETKNVQCGEGGALIVNDPALVERAEVLHEKGTDRARFHRGEVDRYSWRDVGSSYAMSDLAAAFLLGQLEHLEWITETRMAVWDAYHAAFADLEADGLVRRPTIPPYVEHNAHIYWLLVDDRPAFIRSLAEAGVMAVSHYVPLHSSPAGRRYGRAASAMAVTDDAAARLVRLPLWAGMTAEMAARVIDATRAAVTQSAARMI